jgi:anti-sigma regulatory factor (Ser/Thr protein kinase)
LLARLDGPLPEAVGEPATVVFDGTSLDAVRRAVAREAAALGLGPERVEDLVIAANEIASNSVRHGGGRGVLRMWADGDAVLCEVRDRGPMTDPLAGQCRPPSGVEGGRGLWLVHQVCDLVQVRDDDGTVVRLHVSR